MSAKSLTAQLSSIADLEGLFENNAEQLGYWYNQLSELNVDELERREDVITVFNAVRLIMQYEHTNSEEMKDLAEREAADMAEREENWEMEREMLKEEISTLRERITSNAGFDEANEAFRAEIDSLTSQNTHLRQLGRDRDRELADQRDRSEELGKRLENLEKERSLFANNQSELEEQIRELNRRLNSKSDVPQRNDWELKRLRQRNEQAITLSNQLQSVIAQNDQLKMEVDRLTLALENATTLIHENTSKYAEFGEQLTFAERSIERLSVDNKELKKQIAQREASLNQSSDQVELTSKEFGEMLRAKEAQIEQLRNLIEKRELEIDELQARVQYQQNNEREEELERLREELVSATDTARKLFGAAIGATSTKGRIGEDGERNIVDPNAELRLRIVQLDKKLESTEARMNELKAISSEMENSMEQKDLINARLNSENQKLREMAFGDADSEVRRIEKQLEFRDRQIQELNQHCSLLQIELHQRIEAIETVSVSSPAGGELVDNQVSHMKGRRRRKGQTRENAESGKTKIMHKIDSESPTRKRRVKFEDFSDELSDTEAKFIEDDEDNNQYSEEEARRDVESAVKAGSAEQSDAITLTEGDATEIVSSKLVLKYKAIEPTVVMMNSLHEEIVRLNQELERRKKELELEKRLRKERENLLINSKQQRQTTKKELDDLRGILFSDISAEEILSEVAEENFSKEADLRSRLSERDLENMELQRLADNIRVNGTEFERRMAEASRRLVFLAIQNSRLERRADTNERLRRAIAQEYARLRVRLQRIISGEDRRSRHLMLENEVNLIEIARLQNTLLHSVPLTEYNRLLRNYKSLIQKETIGGASSSDGGYYSGAATDDDVELGDSSQFDISKTAMAVAARPSDSAADVGDSRWADSVLVKNKRLQEENDVLRSQIEFWQKEICKKDTEIGELTAFLGDIENETELKSMIVNIERRFLQTLREQFDNTQEQMQIEAETQMLRKQLQRRRSEWRAERQALVNLALNLHTILRKVNANRSNVSSASIEQLEALKSVMDSVKEREKLAEQRYSQVEKEALELETKSAFLEASQTSVDTIINNDYQLQYIQANLRGYQLNVLTLSAELRRIRDETDKWKRLANERLERCDDLHRQLDEFNFCNVDLGFLAEIQSSNMRFERQLSDSRKELVVSKESESSRGKSDMKRTLSLEDSSENSESAAIPSKAKGQSPESNAQTIVIDNSEEYHRQIQTLQNTARLCVRNFEEQLAQKDRAIEEYRLLLENLSSSAQKSVLTKPLRNASAESLLDIGITRLAAEQRPKTSAELISAHDAVEEKDYRIFVLERELRNLELANSALADRLSEMEAARRKETLHRTSPKKKDAKVQVNLSSDTPLPQSNVSPARHVSHRTEPKDGIDKKENESEDEARKNSAASHASSSSTSSSSTNESGSDESETDSGTVEDIDNRSQRRSSSRSASTLNGSQSSDEKVKVTAATRRPATASHPRVSSVASQPPPASSGARRTASATIAMGDDVETIVLRNRNETRRLRMRIMALERRNKQISDENESLKERGRFAARRPLDPNSDANIARKENERLQRENKNLAKSLQTQKDELAALQKSLKKSESLSQNKIASEVWEERKRHSHALKTLKQRISQLEASEVDLSERLARREKFIEQLTRDNAQKFGDAQKLTRLQAEWREEKALFEKRELAHRQETSGWAEKYRDISTRLEMFVKENKVLHARNVALQEKLKNPLLHEPQPSRTTIATRTTETKNCATQTSYVDRRSANLGGITLAQAQQQSTPGRIVPAAVQKIQSGRDSSSHPPKIEETSGRKLKLIDGIEQSDRIELIGEIRFMREKGVNKTVEQSETMLLPGGVLSPVQWVSETRSIREDGKSEANINALAKQLRRAELLQMETAEQLESMKKAYEELLNNYKGLLRADLERRREHEESAAVAVLRDKLVGKDHEIDQQRHKIVDLERRLWNLQMGHYKSSH